MSNCIHHYMLEAPTSGKTSVGICKHCGAEKEHYNIIVPKTQWREIRKGQKRKVRNFFIGKKRTI